MTHMIVEKTPAEAGSEGNATKLHKRIPKQQKPGDTIQAVTVAVLVSGLLTGILVLQNTRQARIEFLFWSATLPLSAALLLSAVIGGILGFSVAYARKRQINRAKPSAPSPKIGAETGK